MIVFIKFHRSPQTSDVMTLHYGTPNHPLHFRLRGERLQTTTISMKCNTVYYLHFLHHHRDRVTVRFLPMRTSVLRMKTKIYGGIKGGAGRAAPVTEDLNLRHLSRLDSPFSSVLKMDLRFLLHTLVFLLILGMFLLPVGGGLGTTPIAVGLCYTGCNYAAMACYAAVGVVFGVGNVPACGSIQGACMVLCWTGAIVSPF